MNQQPDPFTRRFRIAGRAGPISDLTSWKTSAAPAGGDKQWRDFRSAKECARAWCEPALGPPQDLVALLDTSELTKQVKFGLVEPEARLPLDEHRGNTRNTDVLAHGMSGDRKVLVAVEAKADEPFGQTIGEAYEGSPPGSNRPDRINRLCILLFGHPYADEGGATDDYLTPLRYQLLHGVGATLLAAESKRAEVAVFAVHVFRSAEGTLPANLERNAADLVSFLRALDAEDSPAEALVEIRPSEALNSEYPSCVMVGSTYTNLPASS